MKSVKIDIAKTGIEIPAEMKAKTQEANALLHSGKGAGNDFLGWVHLPSSISDSELAAIEEVAAKLRAKADLVICIGIGGSYLGARAVLEAMSGEKTDVPDPVEGLIVRNHLTHDQNVAIENVKHLLAPHWHL